MSAQDLIDNAFKKSKEKKNQKATVDEILLGTPINDAGVASEVADILKPSSGVATGMEQISEGYVPQNFQSSMTSNLVPVSQPPVSTGEYMQSRIDSGDLLPPLQRIPAPPAPKENITINVNNSTREREMAPNVTYKPNPIDPDDTWAKAKASINRIRSRDRYFKSEELIPKIIGDEKANEWFDIPIRQDTPTESEQSEQVESFDDIARRKLSLEDQQRRNRGKLIKHLDLDKRNNAGIGEVGRTYKKNEDIGIQRYEESEARNAPFEAAKEAKAAELELDKQYEEGATSPSDYTPEGGTSSSSSSLASESKGRGSRSGEAKTSNVVRPKVESILNAWDAGDDWIEVIIDNYAQSNPFMDRRKLAAAVNGVFIENKKAYDKMEGNKDSYQDWVRTKIMEKSLDQRGRSSGGGGGGGRNKRELPEEDWRFYKSLDGDIYNQGEAGRLLRKMTGVQTRITNAAGSDRRESDAMAFKDASGPDYNPSERRAVAAKKGNAGALNLADEMMLSGKGNLGWVQAQQRLYVLTEERIKKLAKSMKGKRGNRLRDVVADEDKLKELIQYQMYDTRSLDDPSYKKGGSGGRKSSKRNRQKS